MESFATRVDAAINTLYRDWHFVPSRAQVEEALQPIIGDLLSMGLEKAKAYVMETYDYRNPYHRLTAVLHRNQAKGESWN